MFCNKEGLINLLTVNGSSVCIPKLFLFCRSDYFSTMFHSGMIESGSNEVHTALSMKMVALLKEYFIMGELNNFAQCDGNIL